MVENLINTLSYIAMVPDIGILIGWITAIYMVIGVTVKFNSSDFKKGALGTIVFALGADSLKSHVDLFYGIRPTFDNLTVFGIILIAMFVGFILGRVLAYYMDRVKLTSRL